MRKKTKGVVKIQGKVKFFNEAKGYGFITGEDNKDYFVHFSAIAMDGYKKLAQEDVVTFESDRNEKGIFAKNVVKV